MGDDEPDDPPAGPYRELLERAARLERLVEQLLQDDPQPGPPASTARLVSTAGSTDRIQLTKREAQILPLLVLGYTNPQIGAQLHLHGDTVRNHLGRIYRKLGVRTRTQAAVRAIELGLISTAPATR